MLIEETTKATPSPVKTYSGPSQRVKQRIKEKTLTKNLILFIRGLPNKRSVNSQNIFYDMTNRVHPKLTRAQNWNDSRKDNLSARVRISSVIRPPNNRIFLWEIATWHFYN